MPHCPDMAPHFVSCPQDRHTPLSHMTACPRTDRRQPGRPQAALDRWHITQPQSLHEPSLRLQCTSELSNDVSMPLEMSPTLFNGARGCTPKDQGATGQSSPTWEWHVLRHARHHCASHAQKGQGRQLVIVAVEVPGATPGTWSLGTRLATPIRLLIGNVACWGGSQLNQICYH